MGRHLLFLLSLWTPAWALEPGEPPPGAQPASMAVGPLYAGVVAPSPARAIPDRVDSPPDCDAGVPADRGQARPGDDGPGEAGERPRVETVPSWRVYQGNVLGLVILAGGIRGVRRLAPGPRSVLRLDPFGLYPGGTVPLGVDVPFAAINGADLLARATGCGATLFAPGQVPLPPDLAGPLGMGTWFVLHEEDRQFGIVDVQGDRVRWVVLTALTTRKYEDGSIGVGATTPLVDLGHYLAHFRCEAPQ